MEVLEITQGHLSLRPSKLALNAKHPSRLADFYQEVLGLVRLTDQDQPIQLAVQGGPVLLDIYPAEDPEVPGQAGLYHMAFLLPDRKALGDTLYQLRAADLPLEGGANHGYSEAIYLTDPEGNGIEIYWDKDPSEWNIQPNGLILGKTDPLPGDELLALADQAGEGGLPAGTQLGHVHLSVTDIQATLSFYHQVMGLGVKFMMGDRSLFMASGSYHHHLGANSWNGPFSPRESDQAPGLRSVYWQTGPEDLDRIQARLGQQGWDFQSSDQGLHFQDPSGISVFVEVHTD